MQEKRALASFFQAGGGAVMPIYVDESGGLPVGAMVMAGVKIEEDAAGDSGRSPDFTAS
jgi:hypothetical protein